MIKLSLVYSIVTFAYTVGMARKKITGKKGRYLRLLTTVSTVVSAVAVALAMVLNILNKKDTYRKNSKKG